MDTLSNNSRCGLESWGRFWTRRNFGNDTLVPQTRRIDIDMKQPKPSYVFMFSGHNDHRKNWHQKHITNRATSWGTSGVHRKTCGIINSGPNYHRHYHSSCAFVAPQRVEGKQSYRSRDKAPGSFLLYHQSASWNPGHVGISTRLTSSHSSLNTRQGMRVAPPSPSPT